MRLFLAVAGLLLALALAAWLFLRPVSGPVPVTAPEAGSPALPAAAEPPAAVAEYQPEFAVDSPPVALNRVEVPTAPERALTHPGWTVLLGQVLDLTGQPLTNAQLDYELRPDPDGFWDLERQKLQTDDTGHFRLKVKVSLPEPGTRRSFTLRLIMPGTSQARCIALLPDPSPEGLDNLGDLALEYPPRIVTGTAVTETGVPLAGIRVSLQYQHSLTVEVASISLATASDSSAMTGPDGSFALFSDETGEQFHISGSGAGFWCQEEEIARGTTGYKLVLRRSGGLSGKVLADDRACLSGIYFELKRRDGPLRQWEMLQAIPKRDGSFEFRELAPGVYRLLVRPCFGDDVLFELEDLMVEPGAVCTDPRVNPYDLRGLIRSLRLSAVDPNGTPISKFSVYDVTIPDEPMHQSSYEGKVTLVGRPSPVDLLVQAEGKMQITSKAVTSDQTVTLRPGPRVRLQVANPGAVPGDCQLKLSLLPASDDKQWRYSEWEVVMNADGTAELVATAFGPSQIQAVLWLNPHGQASVGHTLRLGLNEFEVLDVGGIQTFHFALPELEIAQALEGLRGKR